MKQLIMPDNRIMVFRDINHLRQLLVIMPANALQRMWYNQDPEIQFAIFDELLERKIIFNEIKECLMTEKKYDESHDKVPISTWVMAGIIILTIILGSILF